MSSEKRFIIIAIVVIVIGLGIWGVVSLLQQNLPPESGTTSSRSLPGSSQDASTSGDDQSQVTSSPKPPAKRSDSELLGSIAKQRPELLDSNQQPFFAIVKSERTPNAWYVVTIRHTRDATVSDAKLILKDNGDGAGLVVVAGPGTYFDPQSIALPDEVRRLL